MDVHRRTLFAAVAALGLRPLRAADGAPDLFELPVAGMERLSRTVWVKELTAAVWITCFTFHTTDFGDVATNGLIVADDAGPVIVDTGANKEQGALLVSTAKRLAGKPATSAVVTHFHSDRTGGIDALRDANIPVFAHPYTVGLAQAYDMPVPQPLKGLEKAPLRLGPLELFYPGPGHTRDNITVWHQKTRTLFGGCFLRAITDKGIGSRADADLHAYPASVARLAERYPERRFSIPGHGTMAGDALTWTQKRVSGLLVSKPEP